MFDSFFWTSTYTTLLGAAISLAASIGVGVFTYLYTRNRNKDVTFLKLYEELVKPERQHGREVLQRWVEENTSFVDAPPEQRAAANHAMAWLQLAAFMWEKGHVSRDDAIELWGRTSVRTYEAAVITGMWEVRNKQQGRRLWPHYDRFYREIKDRPDMQEYPSPLPLPMPQLRQPAQAQPAPHRPTDVDGLADA